MEYPHWRQTVPFYRSCCREVPPLAKAPFTYNIHSQRLDIYIQRCNHSHHTFSIAEPKLIPPRPRQIRVAFLLRH